MPALYILYLCLGLLAATDSHPAMLVSTTKSLMRGHTYTMRTTTRNFHFDGVFCGPGELESRKISLTPLPSPPLLFGV